MPTTMGRVVLFVIDAHLHVLQTMQANHAVPINSLQARGAFQTEHGTNGRAFSLMEAQRLFAHVEFVSHHEIVDSTDVRLQILIFGAQIITKRFSFLLGSAFCVALFHSAELTHQFIVVVHELMRSLLQFHVFFHQISVLTKEGVFKRLVIWKVGSIRTRRQFHFHILALVFSGWLERIGCATAYAIREK